MNSNYRRFLFEEKQNYHIYFDENRTGISPFHHHKFHHCVYVTHGKFTQTQHGTHLILRPGECLFTPAGVDHEVEIFDDTKYFCLSFSQNIADILFSHIPQLRRDFRNLPPVVKVPSDMEERLFHCLSCLLDEQSYEEDISLQTAHFLTITALVMLLRNEFPSSAKTLPFLDPRMGHAEAEIIRCIQHIQANYDQPLTIDGLARISALSRSSFCNAFRQHTGKTVKEFITELRIKEAKQMIATSNIPIHSIAEMVGYSDFSTFYRNFIHITGISPAKYKELAGLKACSHNPAESDMDH